MAIVNFAQFEELPSRVFLLSSQSLALIEKEEDAEISEFDLMNLNGLYRLLADFKSNELGDRASTGVLGGIDQNEGFDQVSASHEAQVTASAISDGLHSAYGPGKLVDMTDRLQNVLVKLAGLTPAQPVVDQDLSNARTALTAIIEKLKSASLTPQHA